MSQQRREVLLKLIDLNNNFKVWRDDKNVYLKKHAKLVKQAQKYEMQEELGLI